MRPASSDQPTFTVNWAGDDDANGTGLKAFDVYVSENNSQYQPFVTGTTERSAVFTGKYGKNYRFYSIASDNAGNREAAPETFDHETTVVGGAFEGDVAPRPNGDNDGRVSAADLEQLRQLIVAPGQNYQNNELQRADVAPLDTRGDARLSAADAVQARRFAAGLGVVPEAAGPNQLDSSISAEPKSPEKLLAAPRALRPMRVGQAANKLTVAVDLEAQGDEVAAGFTLNFNPAHLSNPANIQRGDAASNAVLTVNTANAATGKIGILLDKDLAQPFAAGTRRLVTIEFDVAANAPATTAVNFVDNPTVNETVNSSAATLAADFIHANIRLGSATAAAVQIGGRVATAKGKSIADVRVSLTDASGATRFATTNAFGYYRFNNVASGASYIVAARHKFYRFENDAQVVNIVGDADDIDFIAAP